MSFVFLNVLCILIEFPSLINDFRFLCMTTQIVGIEYSFTLIDLHIIVIEIPICICEGAKLS